MPGFYYDGEYDLAGFIVGAVDRDKMVTGAASKPGERVDRAASTGLHTNGYSLARKLLFEVGGYKATQYVTAIKEKAGAALMKTHRSYLHVIQKLSGTAGSRRHGAHHQAPALPRTCRAFCPMGLPWTAPGGDRLNGRCCPSWSICASWAMCRRIEMICAPSTWASAYRGHSRGEIHARQESAGTAEEEILLSSAAWRRASAGYSTRDSGLAGR